MNEYFTESLSMRYPKNYFMQWFRKKESSGQIKFNFHFEDQVRYLSDVLTDEIDKWSPEVPVVISAQTGSGKNHFILETLLPKLIEENPGQKDLILILSNRIALNRQTKRKLANLLVEFAHDAKYITEMKKYFTNEGVDHIYINFDVVTVCSYHQLYNRCNRLTHSVNAPNFIGSIDISKFKYIVCDECHFFTSDATFNQDTGNTLKEIVAQGQNAVRIYMSATPEVVVEAILREEFSTAQMRLNEKIENINEEITTLNAQNIPFMCKMAGATKKTLKKAENFRESCIEDLECEKKKIESNFNLHVCFYYMARNYDYVVAHCYQTDEQLVEVIQSSEDKWIIFMNTGGNALAEKLNQKGVSAVFLSRERTDADEEKRDAYNFIIENETTDRKVLISTSLLDNGINITNAPLKNAKDKVLNIAIDSFDRTQFIQMLGRIRTEKDVPVQLYIKEYSSERLKRMLGNDTRNLVRILSDKIYGASPTEFNSCAVYLLVDRMSTVLTMIRSTEPDFCIEFKDDYTAEALKGKVYEFYKTGKGKSEPWSRSIVDLLESSWERDKRKKYIYSDICNGEEDVNRHESKLSDTFLCYLCQKLIPQQYYSAIEEDYNFYASQLNDSEWNCYNRPVRCAEDSRGTLSFVEKIELLNSKFNFASKKILVDIERVKTIESRATHYENLADGLSAGTTVDVQLNWIEKSPEDLIAIKLASDSSEKNAMQEESLENYIRAHHVTASEVEQFKRGKYLDKDFISRRGIKKDSTSANTLSEKFFQGKSLKEMLNEKWSVDGNRYVLESFADNTNSHTTFYCFVKQDVSEF